MADTHTRQTQLHIKYMVKQLRWNQTVAGDILATLDNIQLASGFATPILEAPDLPIDYIDQGWILDLRDRLREIGATMWVEDAWQPPLQRVHDVSLMEQFLRVTTTKSQRRQLRAVLHWLRVITLADLADPSGRFIPGHRVVGKWQAESTLEWPHQPKPNKAAFATFRRALRNTICLGTSHYQPPHQDMVISNPLGNWLDVDRNVTSEYSRWEDELFCRVSGDLTDESNDTTILRFQKRPGDTGFFSYDGTATTVPPRAIPISCQFVDSDKVWTKKPFIQPLQTPTTTPPVGSVRYDTLDKSGKKLKGASDGSLYREEKTMAAAWLIANDDSDSNFMIASVVLHNVSSLSSYRAELEGTLRLLKHIEQLGMSPEEIQYWCDNESAVKANNLDKLHTPADMLAPDADLLLALLAHKKRLQTIISCGHVFSHQDQVTKKSKKVKEKERKRRQKERRERIREVEIEGGTHAPSPSVSSESDSACSEGPDQELGAEKHLSDEAHMNNACDDHAKGAAREYLECPDAEQPLVMEPPYEGTKAMLRIGDVWITSNLDENIHFACRAPIIREYCKQRHNWDDATLDLIDFEAIGRVRKTQTWTEQTRSMKVLHGWLAVMHNLGKRTGITQCPGCHCVDETFLHMFSCEHKLMKKATKESLEAIHKSGRGSGMMPRPFMDKFIACLEAGIQGEELLALSGSPAMRQAIQHQNQIGTSKLLQGYLARSWADALEEFGCKRVTSKISWLLRQIWDTLFHRLWDTRNFVLHHTPNCYRSAESTNFAERLRWYRDNRNLVLAQSDHKLADHGDEEIERMGRKTRRKWVRTLDRLRKTYATELKQLERGQTTLTHFLVKPTSSEAAPATVARSRPKHRPLPVRIRKFKQTKLKRMQQLGRVNLAVTSVQKHEKVKKISRKRKLSKVKVGGDHECLAAQVTPSPHSGGPRRRGPPEPD